MRGIESEIAEVEFHIDGFMSLIRILSTADQRVDTEIIRTLAYGLELSRDRYDVLVMMKAILR